MGIKEREWKDSTFSYRFGFNGQEMDDEIAGEGNHNTALFWEYDTRIGRRWNQDPKPNPSISDYATFANNPIWFNDPLGDIFKIGTKDKQAKTDVTNQVKTKNQKYLKFQEDGEVKTDFGGLSQKKIDKILKKDEGLSLISNLSTAKDDKGNDINFFYGTEGDVGARDRTTGEKLDIPFPAHPSGYETTKPDFFLNLSVTPYSAENPYILPKEGYQGQVMVAPGYGTVSEQQNVYNSQGEVTGTKTVLRNVRSEIIFHELRENYLRTVYKLPYKEAHQKAGGIGEINSFIFK
jgi:RHS repeat-associated protein